MNPLRLGSLFLLPFVLASASHSAGGINPKGSAMYASWSPDGSRLAYMTSRDGNYEIYTIGVDGSNPQRLTENLASDGLPSWSPDGKTIAYASDNTHFNGRNVFYNSRPYAIFLMDADGENKRRLTNLEVGNWRPDRFVFEDTHPVWSPDGSTIAFLSDRRNGYREIFVVDPATGKTRQITHSGVHHNNPTWTPDGKRILFDAIYGEHHLVGPNSGWGLFTVRITAEPAETNRQIEPFLNLRESEIEYDAALSPDGSTLAFVMGWSDPAKSTGKRGLFFARTDDIVGTMHQPHAESEFWPKWSPQGDKIAVTSDRDGHREIYVMDADGENVRRLTHSR